MVFIMVHRGCTVVHKVHTMVHGPYYAPQELHIQITNLMVHRHRRYYSPQGLHDGPQRLPACTHRAVCRLGSWYMGRIMVHRGWIMDHSSYWLSNNALAHMRRGCIIFNVLDYDPQGLDYRPQGPHHSLHSLNYEPQGLIYRPQELHSGHIIDHKS